MTGSRRDGASIEFGASDLTFIPHRAARQNFRRALPTPAVPPKTSRHVRRAH